MCHYDLKVIPRLFVEKKKKLGFEKNNGILRKDVRFVFGLENKKYLKFKIDLMQNNRHIGFREIKSPS